MHRRTTLPPLSWQSGSRTRMRRQFPGSLTTPLPYPDIAVERNGSRVATLHPARGWRSGHVWSVVAGGSGASAEEYQASLPDGLASLLRSLGFREPAAAQGGAQLSHPILATSPGSSSCSTRQPSFKRRSLGVVRVRADGHWGEGQSSQPATGPRVETRAGIPFRASSPVREELRFFTVGSPRSRFLDGVVLRCILVCRIRCTRSLVCGDST
jgi:hypothetical protein